jgi:hypothetical protein
MRGSLGCWWSARMTKTRRRRSGSRVFTDKKPLEPSLRLSRGRAGQEGKLEVESARFRLVRCDSAAMGCVKSGSYRNLRRQKSALSALCRNPPICISPLSSPCMEMKPKRYRPGYACLLEDLDASVDSCIQHDRMGYFHALRCRGGNGSDQLMWLEGLPWAAGRQDAEYEYFEG